MTILHRTQALAHSRNDETLTERRPDINEFDRISGTFLTTGRDEMKPERPYVYGAHRKLAAQTLNLAWIAQIDQSRGIM